ncbi:hypothetical protein GCM10010468_64020 [Actinocorallia longicatena]|uniref:Acyltransferase-like protein n=1 Tax=Actinocorallia longicatena TaxID=111803 RepID=A0ABP6QLS8_9ACTN
MVGTAWTAGALGGAAPLRVAPLAWLGTLSYGIYLWHMAVIEGWYPATGRPVRGHDFGTVTLVTAVVVLPLAALTYALPELPAQGSGRGTNGNCESSPAGPHRRHRPADRVLGRHGPDAGTL